MVRKMRVSPTVTSPLTCGIGILRREAIAAIAPSMNRKRQSSWCREIRASEKISAALIFSLARISLHQLDWRFLFMLGAMAAMASRLSIPIPHVKGEVTVGDTLIFLTMLLYDGEAAVLM